ncbi:MAG: trigger factor [Phycisphaerae bacterium]|nr:trigger factor [Phycisphaerae bacterium]
MDQQTDAEKTEKIKNIVSIEDCGPCKKKFIVEIPEQKITKVFDAQYSDLRKEAVLPGFRKGRAPRRLLEKRFGKETAEQVKLKLLAEASDEAIKDNEIKTLGDPDIDPEKIELPQTGSLKFEFEVEVRPEFDLPKLSDIEINKPKHVVTDEQVDGEIEQFRKYAGVWTPKQDGKIEQNDQIVANAILKIEGVEEDEKLDNTEMTVRKNGFVGDIPVENLDELLIGAKSGDTKNISVEVPKTYFKEEYRGKKVDVTLDIKEIKHLKPADLDENLLKRLGVEDEQELCDRIRERLEANLEQQVRSEMSEQLYRYMLDNTNFDLPTSVVSEQAANILQRQYISLLRRGLPKEQIEERMEELKSSSEEQAKEQLKTFFIMDKVADELGIEVTEEEINGQIAQTAIQQKQRPERLREEMARNGSLAQMGVQIREQKCIEKLLESAKISEIEPEKTEKNEEKQKKTKKTTKKPEKTKENDDSEEKKVKKTKKPSPKKSE